MHTDAPFCEPLRHLPPAILRRQCPRFPESFFAQRKALRAHLEAGTGRPVTLAEVCSTSTPLCSTCVAPQTSLIPNIHAGCSTVALVAPPCAILRICSWKAERLRPGWGSEWNPASRFQTPDPHFSRPQRLRSLNTLHSRPVTLRYVRMCGFRPTEMNWLTRTKRS